MLVKGPEVDFVKRRGGDLFMPIQNQNGDVLVMLAAEVSFAVRLLGDTLGLPSSFSAQLSVC